MFCILLAILAFTGLAFFSFSMFFGCAWRDSVGRWKWILFCRPKHSNRYILCLRSWSFKCFSLHHTIINFLFASINLLTNFENSYWNHPQNFLLCGWSISQVPTSHWLLWKSAGMNLSQALPVWFYRNRRLPVSIFSVKIDALGFLKRVTWRTFKICK